MDTLKVLVEKRFFNENKGEDGEWDVEEVPATLVEEIGSDFKKDEFNTLSGNFYQRTYKTDDGKIVVWSRCESDPIGGKYKFS